MKNKRMILIVCLLVLVLIGVFVVSHAMDPSLPSSDAAAAGESVGEGDKAEEIKSSLQPEPADAPVDEVAKEGEIEVESSPQPEPTDAPAEKPDQTAAPEKTPTYESITEEEFQELYPENPDPDDRSAPEDEFPMGAPGNVDEVEDFVWQLGEGESFEFN